MCDYTQVEYNCQHFRFVVLRWCSRYERTYKPCAPNVTHLETPHSGASRQSPSRMVLSHCCYWSNPSVCLAHAKKLQETHKQLLTLCS
ncbi:hypothetical protein F5Y19DRAFT_276023 [Xylariaceae sp. FL1651]|nr:hypothetical protein F5Y19DRAFT_276023 [Xylariaceae sp. FL1651]